MTDAYALDDWYRFAYDHGFPRYMMATNDVLAYRPNAYHTNAFGVWPFADPTFTTGLAQDWRGTAHMTPANMAAATVNGTNGVAVFNGSSSYLINTTANYNSGASSGTINAWVNPTRSSGMATADTIFCSADTASATRFFFIFLANGSLYLDQRNDDTQDRNLAAIGYTSNQWCMVTCVSSGTGYTFYKNGVLYATQTAFGANNGDWLADTSARDNFVFGVISRSTTTDYFKGSIDEPLIDNTAYTSNQVHQLYLYTKGKFGL
jgi:hypothetical protein